MTRTTIRERIGETDYLATWLPLNKMIVVDRNRKYYAIIRNISTFEDAQNYMKNWFAHNAPERQ